VTARGGRPKSRDKNTYRAKETRLRFKNHAINKQLGHFQGKDARSAMIALPFVAALSNGNGAFG